jgi:nucleoside-diphosphate-sugar epimerase
MSAKSRVLVTGASGFIGRHVISALDARGWEIHAAALGSPLGVAGIRWHTVDLLAPGEPARLVAAVRPSHLLHLAWYAEPARYWTSRENLRWARASIDLAEAFLDAGGQRIVGAGSCAEYDWQSGHCVEGDTPLVPATLYGAAKRATGLMVEAMAAQAGVSSAWARLFFVYGPFEHPDRLVSSVVRALVAGQVAECSDGRQVRDFLYVKDVADALAAILESGVTGAVNVASGQPISVWDVVLRIGALVGRPELVRLGARPSDKVPRLTASTDRLGEVVGWAPQFTLDRALIETIDWWQAQRSAHGSGPAETA